MDLEFTDDQKALLDSIQSIVADYFAPSANNRRGRYFYSEALEKELFNNGFFDVMRTPGMGTLETVLVIEEVSKSASVVEIGASALVAPMLTDEVLPRPIAMADGDLSKAKRFLPIAKTLLYNAGDKVLVLPIDQDEIESLDSIYAYPMGRFKKVPDLSKARVLGGPELAARMTHWQRLSVAAECAGSMHSAVDFIVEYVTERKLFNKTIANFQAVQHRLAQAHRVSRALHFLILKAGWSQSPFDADQAASFAQQHIQQLVFDLHQFNGGMGVTNENLLHFWTYRMRALQSETGGANAAALATANQLWGVAAE